MRKMFLLLICMILITAVFAGAPTDLAGAEGPQTTYLPMVNKASNALCQFGIAIGSGSTSNASTRALLDRARASAVITWGAGGAASYPGMDYTNVLFVGDFRPAGSARTRYQESLALIETLVPQNLGQVWLIGNEPDTTYFDQGGTPQDNLRPEVYARRYFAIASRIRQLDPTAQLGFGNIVQPTPIRLRYLARAWNELVNQAGSQEGASDLVDIWVSHSFILNEEPTLDPAAPPWGTGIPPGFENDYGDAFVIGVNFNLTYSNQVFETNIRALRAVMADFGERDKPLWITEYGSLFPPIDPPGRDYVNVSDEATAQFMVGTFDFMRTATDASTGMPAANNRLVQRWYWYSLSGPRYYFGGSLFDPDNNYAPTVVGSVYLNYVAALPTGENCLK